jgi:hypothetical protein
VRNVFQGLALVVLVMLTVGLPQQRLVAQSDMDLKPGVVISLTNLNEHLSDVEHLVDAAGFGQMKGLVRMGVSEYIKGIDPEKPIGAMLFFEGDNPEPEVMAFLPVTDFEEVLDTIAQFVDIEGDDDSYVLTTDDGTEMHVRIQEGYAFVSEKSALLENLPTSPVGILGELPSQYNFAARVFGQRIPAELRQQAIDLIRSGAEENMDPADDSPEAALQRANFDYSMKSIEGLINDTEEVVAGLTVDQDEKRIYIDVKFVGTPDSNLARQCKIMKEAPPTRFAGFLRDDATMTFNFCGKFGAEELGQVQTMIDQARDVAKKGLDKEVDGGRMSESEREIVNRALGNFLDVAGESLKSGIMDTGGTVMLSEEMADLAVGMHAVNPGKLEASLKELADIVKSRGAPVTFRFDARTENGIRYHEIDVAIPEDEEEARSVLGEKITIVVGVGDDVVYVAAGKSPNQLLSQCIVEKAPADLPSTQFNMHLIPLLRFVSQFQNAAELGAIADALPQTGDDRIRMTGTIIENGEMIRVEMEDGIIEIFAKVGQAMSGGFAPPDQF